MSEKERAARAVEHQRGMPEAENLYEVNTTPNSSW
jgi:hypothetical protein